MSGIIRLKKIAFGSLSKLFTTLVLQVGEFPMADAMEFGRMPSVQAILGIPHPIGIQQTKEWTFPKQTRS